MANEKVTLELGIELDKSTVIKALGTIPKEAEQSLSQIKKTSRRIGQESASSFGGGFGQLLKKQVFDFSGTLKAGLGLGLGLSAANSVINTVRKIGAEFSAASIRVKDFERSIAEINTILPDSARLSALTTSKISELAASFGSSNTLQARAFYDIVSAGVRGASNQITTLTVANKAAIAGLVGVDQTAKVLVSSVNSYAKSGLTATRASDVLFKTVEQGITTFGELADFIGNVAPIGAAAGVSFEELAGSIAAITKNGIRTDIAVTGIRNVLTAIIAPTKEASDEANRLGIQFNAAALESQGLASFLQKLAIASGGSTESLSKLFGNVRGLVPILGIVKNNFGDFKRVLDEVTKSYGATDRAAKIVTSTYDQQSKILGKNFDALFDSIAEKTQSILLPAITAINKLFEKGTTSERIAEVNKQLEEQKKVVNGLALDVAEYEKNNTGLLSGLRDFIGVQDTLKSKYEEERAELERLNALKRELIELRKSEAASGTGGGQSPFVGPIISPEQMAENIAQNETFLNGLLSSQIDYENQVKNSTDRLSRAFFALGQNMKSAIGNGIGAGFGAFGAALASGENALDAFAKSFLSTLGQMMIQQGTMFILQGLGFQVIPGLQASGGVLVGAGAALATAGGVLTALGGNAASSGATATSGGGAAGGQSSSVVNIEAEELEEPDTRVTVNIQGNIIDSPEAGSYIIDAINRAVDGTGATIRRNALA